MKKTLALLCATCMLVALTACGSGSKSGTLPQEAASKETVKLTPIDCYTKAVESNKKDSQKADYNMDVSIDVTAGQESQHIGINSKVKADLSDQAAPKMDINMTMEMPTLGSVETYICLIDGMLYMNMLGAKSKSEVQYDQVSSALQQSSSPDFIQASDLMDIQSEQDGDNTILTFTCKKDATSNYLNNLMKKASSTSSTTDMTYAIKEYSGKMTVDKENRIKDMTVNIDTDTTQDGKTANMKIKSTLLFNAYGDEVVVAAPADADSYQTVDSSTILKNEAA